MMLFVNNVLGGPFRDLTFETSHSQEERFESVLLSDRSENFWPGDLGTGDFHGFYEIRARSEFFSTGQWSHAETSSRILLEKSPIVNQ